VRANGAIDRLCDQHVFASAGYVEQGTAAAKIIPKRDQSEGQGNDGAEKKTRQSTMKTDAMGVGEGGWGSSVAAMAVGGIRMMDKGGW